MGLNQRTEFTFVCPTCDETLSVNGAMKRALLENGCVLCSAELTDRAFTLAE